MPMKTMLFRRPVAPDHGPRGELLVGGEHLRDDLGLRQVALQPALAGGAERAGHAAAGLRRDAQRRAVRVAHQHGLEQRTVEELPQRLHRRAVVGHPPRHLLEQPREQLLAELRADGRGKVGERRRVVLEAVEHVPGDLVGAEARQAEVRGGLDALLAGEVEPVLRRLAPAGRLEDERQEGRGHGSPENGVGVSRGRGAARASRRERPRASSRGGP